MEKEVAELLYNTLKNDTDVSEIIGTRIKPIVVPEGTEYPFMVYSISDTSGLTKDNAETFNVLVFVCFEGIKDYMSLLELKAKVKAALEPTPFMFQESDTDFDEESGNIFGVMRYLIINY